LDLDYDTPTLTPACAGNSRGERDTGRPAGPTWQPESLYTSRTASTYV